MIDKQEAIKTLKLAYDALVDNNPMVIERIFHDDSLLEDKTTPDYQTAFAICSIQDVIELLGAEPDKEDIDYDFDETRFFIRGINEEFWSEEQAIERASKLVHPNTNGATFHIVHKLKGTVTQEFPYGTIHIASPQEKK